MTFLQIWSLGNKMDKITTEDCKKAIEEWLESGVDEDTVPSFGIFTDPTNGSWKRLKKYKGSNGKIVREFARKDRDYCVLYVVEDNGVLWIGETNPADIWYFQIDEINE